MATVEHATASKSVILSVISATATVTAAAVAIIGASTSNCELICSGYTRQSEVCKLDKLKIYLFHKSFPP